MSINVGIVDQRLAATFRRGDLLGKLKEGAGAHG